MRALAGTFKALSDETRLQIMALLLDNAELCVCDFVGALGLTQSKASRHLRYLYNAGLVQDRRDGLWMHYRLASTLRPEQRLVVEALSAALPSQTRRELRRRLAAWLAEKDPECCEVQSPDAKMTR
jgi:ArsR family transcriptional regulator, arsenate/arsenite/antimonite-responsive transcriptional repressor